MKSLLLLILANLRATDLKNEEKIQIFSDQEIEQRISKLRSLVNKLRKVELLKELAMKIHLRMITSKKEKQI